MIEYFSFVTLFYQHFLPKISVNNFFLSQTSRNDEHVPSLQHEAEFYWLERCQNTEHMSDFLINDLQERKCTSKR